MKPEEHTEEAIILDFTVSDEALEQAAADTIFSLGNCTDARVCQAPNGPSIAQAASGSIKLGSSLGGFQFVA